MLLADITDARAVVSWLQRLRPQVRMSSLGQWAHTYYFSTVKAAALLHYLRSIQWSSLPSVHSEGAIVAAHNFLPRSITIP